MEKSTEVFKVQNAKRYCKCIVCKKADHDSDAIYCTRCGTRLKQEKPLIH